VSVRAILLVWVLVLAAASHANAAGTAGVEGSAWVQLGIDGGAAVRLITRSDTCPAVSVDGRALLMRERVAPSRAFPVRVCQVALPPSARHVTLGSRILPVPSHRMARIALLGDTGCRILGPLMQGCNDPSAWPFPRIAQAIAAKHPDLIVHVGDYYYRESRCYIPSCFHSPHGDVYSAWAADWFTPAAPLFAAAPLVLTRGNHEVCDRGGEGWRRFLSVASPARCSAYEAPYLVSLGAGLQLLDFDSSAAPDNVYRPQVAPFHAALQALPAHSSGSTWIVSHRPFWGLEGDLFGVTHELSQTLAEAAHGVPLHAQAMISGHAHLFEVLHFADGRPSQFVVGDSGDWLGEAPIKVQGDAIDGTTVRSGYARKAFGFAMIDRDRGTLTGYDVSGSAVIVCRFPAGTCEPVYGVR
jgi:hypothetical protein